MATLPSPNPIPNSALVNYEYIVDPSIPVTVPGSNITNIVNTQVNIAQIDYTNGQGMIKSGVPSYVKLGDTITYTITLTNTGNTTANNVVVTDTLPIGTINQAPAPPYPVGSIGPGVTATVTFTVVVSSIPVGGTIPNNSTVNFNYVVDPSLPAVPGSGNSNEVDIPVKQATIDNADGGFVKSADKSSVKVGDTVTYTIGMTNTGNTTANNVFLSDTIPTGTTFVTVPNSVTVNGVTIPGADPNPPSSIPVGNIGPGATSTVSFNVVVNTIPPSGIIPNDGTVNFDYVVDPSLPAVPGSGNTNTVIIGVNQATIDYTNGRGMIKSFSPAAVKLGEVITYTVGLKNTGNATATSVTFSDTIPTGTTFVANSVTVNSVTIAGANPAPPSSVPVGTIAPGAISTVSFAVTVVTLPATGTIPNDSTVNFKFTADPSVPDGATGSGNSNQVITPVNEAIIDKANDGMVKSGSPSVVKLGDTLTYTVVLKNSGNTTAVNVVFTDTTPVGTTNPTPVPPINVGDIAAGGTATVSFTVDVVSIPVGGTIVNDSTINFVYTKDPSLPNGESGSGNSNTLQTPLKQA
ncbi:DUF7507 domain-containing protein, partial [Romboutsia sp.]|uniref:DUF7507 domain-containing protein n=1 Tax=Romboutsia sp. TaxID=1965302 RepID=UPI003F31D63B